ARFEQEAQGISIIERLNYSKLMTIRSQTENTPVGDSIQLIADSLKMAAAEAKSPHVAALLLIKQGDALRADLHYRPEEVDPDVVENMITQARTAYEKALIQAQGNNTLVAMANFGLGMCAEEIGDYTKAEKLCYVTMNPSHSLVKQHIRAGGQAFVLEQGMNGHMITIYDNESHTPLLWTHLIPATIEGRALHNVQNAMFAAALAYNMNISLEDIRHGLRTFDSSFFQAPGRMNIYDEHPFRVILDYAHNPAAVSAMCGLVDRLGAEGNKTIVLAAPGDRRDEDIREIAAIASSHFDRFICRCDDNRRGRGEDEVAVMLKNRLLELGVSADRIEVVPDEQEATARALESSSTGDLLLILGDNTKRTWKQIIYFNSGAKVEDADTKATMSTDLPDIEGFTLTEDLHIISDERGVRIARGEESD
ncbi:MAG: cyanophycin synthetase, partial [Proteobacteria bacterium]|nr:cyanophycin synthetase [Pseudomonadota bacterium]